MEFTSIAKYHSIHKRWCFVHAKQFDALLLNFYTENTSVRFELSEEACDSVLRWCRCYRGQNRKIYRRKSNTAAAFPASLALPRSRYLLHMSRRSWVSKHLRVFISIERFIGLPCNPYRICSFLTSGAGTLYPVQSSWFTSYRRIMSVLYSHSVIARVTYPPHADQNMMLLSGLWIHR